jgi:hypothetical protein
LRLRLVLRPTRLVSLAVVRLADAVERAAAPLRAVDARFDRDFTAIAFPLWVG